MKSSRSFRPLAMSALCLVMAGLDTESVEAGSKNRCEGTKKQRHQAMEKRDISAEQAPSAQRSSRPGGL